MKRDVGWAWMVVLASFSQRIFQYGLTTTTGILYVVFKEEFKQSSGITSIVGSLANATSFLLGPLASVLANRFGYRVVVIVAGIIAAIGLVSSMFANSVSWLIVTYGIITGVGFGLTIVPGSCVVAEYFDRKRNIAMGLASSGGGLGSFIFPPLLQTLINVYGWKGTMLICGALTLNVCACGAIYRPTSELQSKSSDNERKSKLLSKYKKEGLAKIKDDDSLSHSQPITNKTKDRVRFDEESMEKRRPKACHFEMFSNKQFLLLCFNNVLATSGFSIIYVHLIAYATMVGIDANLSAWLFTVMGLMNLFGKFGLGVLANHPKISEHVLYILSLGMGGLATLALPWIPTKLPYLMVYATIAGLSISALGGAIIPALLVEYSGMDALSSTFGVLLITNGLGFFGGAPVAGFIFDKTGDYHASFYLAGSLIFFSSLIMLLPWKYWDDNRVMTSPEPDLLSTTRQLEEKQLSPNIRRSHLFGENFVGSIDGLDRVVSSHQDLRSICSGDSSLTIR